MDYVKDIRALVGHRPIILAAAAVLVVDERRRLLLQLRADTRDWGIPGGYMELSESPEETARRELFEETGLTAEEFHLLDVLAGPRYVIQYPNGDVVHALNLVYLAHGVKGSPRYDHESLELRYFPLNELPEPMLSSNRAILDRVLPKLTVDF